MNGKENLFLYRLNVFDLRCLGPMTFQIWFFFRFWNTCWYRMRYLGEPTLNTKFCISYTPYTKRLKVILYKIFSAFVLCLPPITWGQVWNLPFVTSCWNSKAFRFLSTLDFRFRSKECLAYSMTTDKCRKTDGI
jgi:hypothetical protein